MELISMKRFQPFPNESAKVGQILFWLFPYEQDTFRRRKSRVQRGGSRSGAQVRGLSSGTRLVGRALAS
jgi:hypothetical protein